MLYFAPVILLLFQICGILGGLMTEDPRISTISPSTTTTIYPSANQEIFIESSMTTENLPTSYSQMKYSTNNYSPSSEYYGYSTPQYASYPTNSYQYNSYSSPQFYSYPTSYPYNGYSSPKYNSYPTSYSSPKYNSYATNSYQYNSYSSPKYNSYPTSYPYNSYSSAKYNSYPTSYSSPQYNSYPTNSYQYTGYNNDIRPTSSSYYNMYQQLVTSNNNIIYNNYPFKMETTNTYNMFQQYTKAYYSTVSPSTYQSAYHYSSSYPMSTVQPNYYHSTTSKPTNSFNELQSLIDRLVGLPQINDVQSTSATNLGCYGSIKEYRTCDYFTASTYFGDEETNKNCMNPSYAVPYMRRFEGFIYDPCQKHCIFKAQNLIDANNKINGDAVTKILKDKVLSSMQPLVSPAVETCSYHINNKLNIEEYTWHKNQQCSILPELFLLCLDVKISAVHKTSDESEDCSSKRLKLGNCDPFEILDSHRKFYSDIYNYNPQELVGGSISDIYNPLELVKDSVPDIYNPLELVKGSVPDIYNPLELVKGSVPDIYNPLELVKGSTSDIYNPLEFARRIASGGNNYPYNPFSIDGLLFPTYFGTFGSSIFNPPYAVSASSEQPDRYKSSFNDSNVQNNFAMINYNVDTMVSGKDITTIQPNTSNKYSSVENKLKQDQSTYGQYGTSLSSNKSDLETSYKMISNPLSNDVSSKENLTTIKPIIQSEAINKKKFIKSKNRNNKKPVTVSNKARPPTKTGASKTNNNKKNNPTKKNNAEANNDNVNNNNKSKIKSNSTIASTDTKTNSKKKTQQKKTFSG